MQPPQVRPVSDVLSADSDVQDNVQCEGRPPAPGPGVLPRQWQHLDQVTRGVTCHGVTFHIARYLIEASTGLFTGSVYRDKSILRCVSRY